MDNFANTKAQISLIVAIVIFALPVFAQQKRGPTPKKSAPAEVREPRATPATFDTLLSSDSYKIYCEVRAVGSLIHSPAVQDLLDPVISLARPPKEFKTVVKWLNTHAEALGGSRMMVASWPSKPGLPSVLMAVEFSNSDEAQKFERDLRGFIPTLIATPSPTPEPAGSPGPGRPKAKAAGPNEQTEPTLPPYQIKQSGTLVLISDRPIDFRKLRARGSKLLEEDPNFALARNRFVSESLFLYIDFKSIEKEEKDSRQKWEAEEQQRIEEEAANRAKRAAGGTTPEVNTDLNSVSSEELPPGPQGATLRRRQSASAQVTLNAGPPDTTEVTADSSASDSVNAKEAAEMSGAFYSLYSVFFGGESKWPDAVAAGVNFEGDTYILRALIVNAAENKSNALPFVPQFVSGAAILPQSPNVFPADTSLFVTASLDYPQIYEGMVKAIANAEESARKYRPPTGYPEPSPPVSPFAIYEKKLGIKIKEDLLPLLGNELALGMPREAAPTPTDDPSRSLQTDAEHTAQKPVTEPNPVIAIAVKDKEAVRKLIPKLIESLAFKGAGLFAQTEKRDDTEITSYANTLSYAFIGDFLVLSADVASTRHVVDSYLNHQTLSSDTHFRNSTRWQPRQVLGSVYVAPDMMQRYYPGADTAASDKLKEFLLRLNPDIEPMTYALSNEGLGPLHELHVPKNLLMLMIAGMSSQSAQLPLITNEAVAKSMMRTVVAAEATFQSTEGDGRFGSLDELLSAGLISKEVIQKYGYRIEVTTSSNKFEATAVPLEYGVTGKLSYFTDESGIVRGGDHGGGAATISDKEIND